MTTKYTQISQAEIDAIREWVPKIGVCSTAAMLDRDKSGISRHAKRLNVRSPFNSWKYRAPEPPKERGKPGRKIPQEKIIRVISMSREGIRPIRIAEAVGLAPSTVHKLRAKHGLRKWESERPQKFAKAKAHRVTVHDHDGKPDLLLEALRRVYPAPATRRMAA